MTDSVKPRDTPSTTGPVDSADPLDGTSLGMLVIVALLLSGCLWTMWGARAALVLHQQDGPPAASSDAGAPDEGRPASESMTARNQARRSSLPDPANDVLLQDVVGGILKIESDGPDELRLAPAQIEQLKALWPQISKQLDANDWGPTPLANQVRLVLTTRQRAAILRMTHDGSISYPSQLRDYVDRLKTVLFRNSTSRFPIDAPFCAERTCAALQDFCAPA